jgi:low affinity Fe/Cu permease
VKRKRRKMPQEVVAVEHLKQEKAENSMEVVEEQKW